MTLPILAQLNTLVTMVRMQIRSGIRWPVGVDFNKISTPGREQIGEKGKILMLQKKGCANRPFYHIEVTRV